MPPEERNRGPAGIGSLPEHLLKVLPPTGVPGPHSRWVLSWRGWLARTRAGPATERPAEVPGVWLTGHWQWGSQRTVTPPLAPAPPSVSSWRDCGHPQHRPSRWEPAELARGWVCPGRGLAKPGSHEQPGTRPAAKGELQPRTHWDLRRAPERSEVRKRKRKVPRDCLLHRQVAPRLGSTGASGSSLPSRELPQETEGETISSRAAPAPWPSL